MASAERRSRRDLWLALAPAALVAAAAFAVTYRFVKPAPPRTIVLASSDEGGGRYYARRYQEILKRDGIALEVRNTAGSAASVALVADEDDETVDVALVVGGPAQTKAQHVFSLGSLSYAPLWVFYRGDPIDDVKGLLGRRIAVGPPESGTAALALALLRAAGVDKAPTLLFPLDRDAAIKQLNSGDLDAAFFVSPAESPAIKRLAAVPGIRLVSFARAEAFSRRFPYLSRLVLPRGVFDLAADLPADDVALLAPTANLIARDSLHPALAYLLMRAASEVHHRPGILERFGEFPAAREAGFPLSSEARRYYQAGSPLLQRYLPFWAANLVDRLWVFLVPVIAVLVPLLRAVPALYRWRVRSRVFRWYGRLKQIELELERDPSAESLREMMKGLDETERSVNRISTPLAFADNLYSFREHVDLVRRRIIRKLADGAGAPQDAALALPAPR